MADPDHSTYSQHQHTGTQATNITKTAYTYLMNKRIIKKREKNKFKTIYKRTIFTFKLYDLQLQFIDVVGH